MEPCARRTLSEWVALRQALWPETPEQDHLSESQAMIWEPEKARAFLARVPGGVAAGFAEAALRHDYVNGCASSPVVFVEGIYVQPAFRKQGLARLLVRAVEEWAVRLGCRELASDTELHNRDSQQMHAALGFEETERVVCFRKLLPGS
ncbi:aminoglycoside 6'-N-acetyltransferase [Microvirga roseola]|uniref:aminoglycoside 6'-N-acetyltransferase n=1 Tax=Microvirga roseola TaxID=2883126 RepID=UPI0038996AE2